MRKSMTSLLAVAMTLGVTTPASSGPTLDSVRAKGFVQCGVSQGLPGFSNPDDKGDWTGIDVDYCRAVAAAVLGGTSLFGGRGSIFPGTVLGAILIQMIYNGLNILNADPYSYPLITAATIFIAVMIDSLRQRQLERLSRRKIRVED